MAKRNTPVHNGKNLPNKDIDMEQEFDMDEDFDFQTISGMIDEEEIKEPESLIDAFDTILENARHSELDSDFYEKCDKAFSYLKKLIGLTKIQCVVIAMLADSGQPLSWRQMASFVGVSRLNFMRYYDQVEELVEKRWLQHRGAHDSGMGHNMSQGYGLTYGVVTALRKNEVFVPENLCCKDTQRLVERLSEHLHRNMRNRERDFKDDELWIQSIMKDNEHLPLAKECGTMDNIHDIALLAWIIADYACCAGQDNEGLEFDFIDANFPDDFDNDMPTMMREDLHDGDHELMKRGWIEHKCVDGMADTEQYVLTDKAKQELIDGFVPMKNKKRSFLNNMPGLVASKKIKAKELFYNPEEQEQITRLSSLLSKEQFPIVQERLESKGMRKGFACLLYGGPGTGKTATAYELARQTGRDIIAISVTHFKDKYVGESEKKLREIFRNYRRLCESKKVTPILLMNEADSIISKRLENVEHSVDQMSNSLQNILLEEIENLDGILIATTNLNNNMDDAFERRFLFKIEFNKPKIEARAKIWKSMISELSDEDALRLSKKYDFSGGEIENISRKSTVEFIINGTMPNFEQVDHFCSQERLNSHKTLKPILGFAV